MIRVGFCTHVLNKGLKTGSIDGIGQYTDALHQHLTKPSLNQQFSLQTFTFSGCSRATVPMGPFGPNLLWSSLTDKNFSKTTQLQACVDVIHATDHHIPRCAPIPTVATVMDVIPLSHPEWVTDRFRSLKSALWKKSLTWTERIITISEYSKSEIVKWTDTKANKISVIPLGVDASWFERSSTAQVQYVRYKYRLPEQFFISIGTLQPRKNIESTLRAHQCLPDKERLQTPLIIIGRAGWKCDALIERIEDDPLKGAVRWLQRVPQQDIQTLLQASSALVFPSLAEGFGLPIVEAFASQVPVITSNSTSLPEVAGDAAILIDPLDIAQIADAMRRIRGDKTLANELITKGLHRARAFSWDNCARATADVYLEMTR